VCACRLGHAATAHKPFEIKEAYLGYVRRRAVPDLVSRLADFRHSWLVPTFLGFLLLAAIVIVFRVLRRCWAAG
jgi:hypothetical protein